MSTYSSTLRIELIGNGEQDGTWGDTTNSNLGTIIESAITGVETITFSNAAVTMTAFNGLPDQARNAVLVLDGTNTAQQNLVAPAVQKTYIIKNGTGANVAITAGGANVVIPNGAVQAVYCDGTDFYGATASFSGVTGTGTTVLSVSPTLTGIPLAPTANAGTSTTQIATTAFVQEATSNVNSSTITNLVVTDNADFGTATKTGTYTQTGTTITVSITNHGLEANNAIYLDFTSGTGDSNNYVIATKVNDNQYTVTSGSSETTSGNVSQYTATTFVGSRVVAASGFNLVGNLSATGNASVTGNLTVSGTTVALPNTTIETANAAAIISLKRNDASITTNDPLGGLAFFSNDTGSVYTQTAEVSVYADGEHNATSSPTRISAFVTEADTTTQQEAWRIDNDGGQQACVKGTPGTLYPSFMTRAYVNYDCTRDVDGNTNDNFTNRFIRGSGNVASVLKNSNGNYTVTFTTAMPDANYAVSIGIGSGTASAAENTTLNIVSMSTTGFNFTLSDATGNTYQNKEYVMVSVVR